MIKKIINRQNGVSLIITFFIMALMLAVVFSLIVILFSQIKIITNTGNSLSAFYAADAGLEKTFYLNRLSPQVGQPGIAAGFCGICETCENTTNDCLNCALEPLQANGCSNPPFGVCDNCRITYGSVFDNRKFDVETTITTDASGLIFIINSTGYYKDVKRTSRFDSSLPR
jgi:hypothetical protein